MERAPFAARHIHPLIHAAGRFPFLRPLVPSLCGKVTLYHFHLGLRDYTGKREIDLARVVVA